MVICQRARGYSLGDYSRKGAGEGGREPLPITHCNLREKAVQNSCYNGQNLRNSLVLERDLGAVGEIRLETVQNVRDSGISEGAADRAALFLSQRPRS